MCLKHFETLGGVFLDHLGRPENVSHSLELDVLLLDFRQRRYRGETVTECGTMGSWYFVRASGHAAVENEDGKVRGLEKHTAEVFVMLYTESAVFFSCFT